MKHVFRNGRYANVTSTLALVVALGGTTAYAANTIRSSDIVNGQVRSVDIGSGQVKSVDIAANAVTSGKVRNGTLLTKDFKPSELASLKGATGATGPAGPKGDTGAAGAPGAAGTARAYAQINDSGPALVTARTKGITAVTRPATGTYCLAVDPSTGITVGSAPPVPTVASVEFGNTTGVTAPNVQTRGANSICGTDLLEIHTFDGATAADTVSFTVIVP